MTAPTASLLLEEDRELLLRLARRAIVAAVAGSPPEADGADRPFLLERRDVFVTLRSGDDLRGCVGTWKGAGCLRERLERAARGAALDDPRFPAVSRDELARVRIEVTILHPPFAIEGPEAIVVGRHGLSVTHPHGRGLLLPQVAIEQGVDAVGFLRLTCRKAGLEPEAWRNGARVEAFTAEIVREAGAAPGAPRPAPGARDS